MGRHKGNGRREEQMTDPSVTIFSSSVAYASETFEKTSFIHLPRRCAICIRAAYSYAALPGSYPAIRQGMDRSLL